MGRFISADDTSNLGVGGDYVSYNLFAYCCNNPVNALDPSGEILISTLILIASAVVGVACATYTAVEMTQTEADIGDTIFYSIGAGLCGFCTIYSLGMSAYALYCNYCEMKGQVPVTEIGGSRLITQGTPHEIGKSGEDIAGINPADKKR